MTTIAWDGFSLAADTQMTSGGGRKGRTTKIHVGPKWVFAGAGDLDICVTVGEWIKDGANRQKTPMIYGGCSFEGMAFDRKTGEAFLVDLIQNDEGHHPKMIRMEMSQWAIGSGGDFALMAMRLGKSAPEAVASAAEFDAYTGGEIQTIEVKKTKCQKRNT